MEEISSIFSDKEKDIETTSLENDNNKEFKFDSLFPNTYEQTKLENYSFNYSFTDNIFFTDIQDSSFNEIDISLKKIIFHLLQLNYLKK